MSCKRGGLRRVEVTCCGARWKGSGYRGGEGKGEITDGYKGMRAKKSILPKAIKKALLRTHFRKNR